MVSFSGGSRNVLTFCKQLRSVVKFFKFMQELKPDVGNISTEFSSPLAEVLLLSDAEISILLGFVKHAFEMSGPKREPKVTFLEVTSQSLPRFLQR